MKGSRTCGAGVVVLMISIGVFTYSSISKPHPIQIKDYFKMLEVVESPVTLQDTVEYEGEQITSVGVKYKYSIKIDKSEVFILSPVLLDEDVVREVKGTKTTVNHEKALEDSLALYSITDVVVNGGEDFTKVDTYQSNLSAGYNDTYNNIDYIKGHLYSYYVKDCISATEQNKEKGFIISIVGGILGFLLFFEKEMMIYVKNKER